MQIINNVIVIGGGHHNTLGVVRALGERGVGVELITFGGQNEKYVSSSKYVRKHTHCVNSKDIPIYLKKRQKNNGNKEVVISCADEVTEVLNDNLNTLSEHYFIPGCRKEGVMVKLMDKTTMINMVGNYGLHAPEIWSLPEDKDKINYPCITKSYVSSHGGKEDVKVFYSKSELSSFLNKCQDDVFVQRFVEKKEEVQFIGCSLNDGETVIIPGMSRIMRSQPNTNTGFLQYGPIDPFYNETVESSKKYIKACGYNGLFSIEFIRSKNDEVLFLEINFRNDGNAWCVTAAGVNLPMIWLKACLGMNYIDELHEVRSITVMPEFQDFKLVLQHKLSFWQWLCDVKRSDAFMDWNKKDKKPFFRFILNKI